MSRRQITGAVLCGGASVRMGQDKATLPVAGKPMAQWVVEAMLAGGLPEVVALGASQPGAIQSGASQMDACQPDASLDIPVIADESPGAGPLAALLTALDKVGDLFVCPCDVPTLPASLVAQILLVADATDRPVVLAFSDRFEPLIGVYRQAAMPPLRDAFDNGARGPYQAIVEQSAVAYASVGTATADVHNVNDPAELPAACNALPAACNALPAACNALPAACNALPAAAEQLPAAAEQ